MDESELSKAVRGIGRDSWRGLGGWVRIEGGGVIR